MSRGHIVLMSGQLYGSWTYSVDVWTVVWVVDIVLMSGQLNESWTYSVDVWTVVWVVDI